MKKRVAGWLGAVLVMGLVAATPPRLHEVTYLGTVRTFTEGSLEVMVVDERSQSESPMSFRVSPDTKYFRGDRPVNPTEVAITIGERCAVTINNDMPGNTALIVRLAEHVH